MANQNEQSTSAATYSISAAARRLGFCRTTTHALINRGELRAMRVGTRRRISLVEIERFIERAEARAAEDRPPT